LLSYSAIQTQVCNKLSVRILTVVLHFLFHHLTGICLTIHRRSIFLDLTGRGCSLLTSRSFTYPMKTDLV